jgi:glycosyltransferase involved in cell wall biosynthesis
VTKTKVTPGHTTNICNLMTRLATDVSSEENAISPTPMSLGSGPVTTVIVDASCFSLPYDYSLCDALGDRGCRVFLARSEFLAGEWTRTASGFEAWNHFYRWSHGKKRQGVFAPLWRIIKAAEHLVDMRQLVPRMRELRPDIIHFQWLPVPMLDGLYLRDLSKVAPLVLTAHNARPHGSLMQRFFQDFRRTAILRYFQAIIVHSQFTKQQLVEKNWAPADRIHVIPHGVLDYYLSLEESSQAAPVTSSNQTVMFFGNIEAYKGLDVLIRAFALLPGDLLARTQLLVAGSPNTDIASLQQLARDLGIEQRMVWKLGYIREKEVPQLFRSASIVALPYRAIDQSGVLMTAMAFGKAIVASRTGGFPEVIKDGVHGILVTPGDVKELAAALLDLLANPPRRRSMEQATSHLARTELSWASSAHKTVALYETVLAERGDTRRATVLR